MAALQVLLGAIGAVPLILYARGRSRGARGRFHEDLMFGLGLLLAAAIYLGFVREGGGGLGALITELIGVALFGAVMWLGLTRSALWLAAGWAAHVGWDLLLHPLNGSGYAPAWYVRACVGFDLVVAAWIALRPEPEEQE